MRIVERYPLRLSLARGEGGWRLLFPLRLALAGIYGAGVSAARLGAAASKPRPLSRLVAGRRPFVVSVGNLVAGGGGKTPCVAALAETIRERGGVPAVVARGYGGALEGCGPCVANGGSDADLARRFGDEAAIYRSRGIPVVTDARRRRGAELAADLFAPTHIILDDAFQHHSLAKDLDILLLDASRPFDGGLLLPAGELRETPRAAFRANAVIFTPATAQGTGCRRLRDRVLIPRARLSGRTLAMRMKS